MEISKPDAVYTSVNDVEAVFGICFEPLALHPVLRSIVLAQLSL
jgi:hypothetical protein